MRRARISHAKPLGGVPAVREDRGREGTLESAAVAAPVEILIKETRLRAILALSHRQAKQPATPTVGFAELRRLADVENSGNFAYHLDRLGDRFVVQSDSVTS